MGIDLNKKPIPKMTDNAISKETNENILNKIFSNKINRIILGFLLIKYTGDLQPTDSAFRDLVKFALEGNPLKNEDKILPIPYANNSFINSE